MKKFLYVLLVSYALFIIKTIPLQAQGIEWEDIFGGVNNDKCYSVQETSDGGYILAGYTYSFGTGESDVYLIKLDSNGDTIWTKTYGGDSYDVGYCVQETSDGGYIIVGYTYSFGAGESDVYLIKTDSNGNVLWTKTFGGASYDMGYSVQETSDGGYVITGYTDSFGAGGSDVYLIKTDSNGNIAWTRTYGGSSSEAGYSVRKTPDGGYIIAGYTYSFGSGWDDVYLIKTDSNGDTLWTKTYGGSVADGGKKVEVTPDGGYIIAGYTESYGAGDADIYLIKTDSIGDTVWTKTYGGENYEISEAVYVTSDRGYIIAGYTESYGEGDFDIYLIKTDSVGDTIWTKTYGGDSTDVSFSVIESSDGGYVVAGYTKSYGSGGADVYLLKIKGVVLSTPNGGELWAGGENHYIEFECFYPGVDHLRLTYSTDGGNTYPYLIEDNIPPTEIWYSWTTPAINSSECRIKVQAISATGDTVAEDISNSNFTIDSESPSEVALISPQNDTFTTSLVTFIWHPATDNLAGVSYYVFQRALNEEFTDGIAGTTTDDTTITLSFSLDTIYYWRVKAVDSVGNEGPWSPIWHFEIDPYVPGIPSPQSPANNSWIFTDTIIFEWTSVSRHFKSPVRYIIAVDTTPQFTLPLVYDTTEYTSDTFTFGEDIYYWKVKAYDLAGNESGWSTIWHFGIDMTPPVIESVSVWEDTGYFFGPFDISAKISDNVTLKTPRLYYKINNGIWYENTMTGIGSNWYRGTIPAIDSQENALIEYYISVEDSAGNNTRSPDTGAYSFTVSVKEKGNVPTKYGIYEVFVKGNTLIIKYATIEPCKVKIRIYDASGRVIKDIRRKVNPGYHEINIPNSSLSYGIYFVEMKVGKHRFIKKIALLK